MALTTIRNEQVRDLTLTLGKLARGADVILRDGSVAMTASLNANGFTVTNLAEPTAPAHAATKSYVDAMSQGLFPKEAVRAASTTNIVLAGEQLVDDIAIIAGNRVLVKFQTVAADNGIYVASAGAWTRASDADTNAKVKAGLFTFVTEGTVNADSGWVLATDNPITVGTTDLVFTQFSGAGQITAGAGLTKTGNVINLETASSSRIVVNADSIDLATTGISAGTYRSVTVDTYGRISDATNPTTLAGYGLTDVQPLDADLTAISALATTGIIARTADGAVSTRTVTGTAGNVTVTNGDGVAGNPTLNLAVTGVTAGEFTKVTVDTFGRISSATNLIRADIPALDWSIITTGKPTTLAGYGITDAASLNANLTSVSALSTIGVVVRSAADTFITRELAVGTGLSIINIDGVAGNPTISMDGSLSSLASLATTGIIVQTVAGTVVARTIQGTAGNVVVTNGDGVAANPSVNLDVTGIVAGTYRSVTVDQFGRVSAATNPTTISGYGLTDAVNKTGDSMTGYLTLSADPTSSLHAATKNYVDAVATGLDVKKSVRAATILTPITLANLQIIDDVSLVAGDRVLVKNQLDATENGIYDVVDGGAWTRSSDADNTPTNEVTSGLFTFVEEGTVNIDAGFVLNSPDPIVLGVTNLIFTQFSGAGQIDAGLGLTKAGNVINVGGTAGRIVVSTDSIDLDTTGVAAGNYNVVTTDVYGRVNAAFLRSLTSASAGLTVTNATGVTANPTLTLDANLVALAGLAVTGLVTVTAAGVITSRTVVSNTVALTVTNGDGIAGNPTIDLDSDLIALAALSTNGIITRTATGAITTRTIAVGAGLTIADAAGVAGNPTISMDGALSSLSSLTTTGIIVQTVAGTVTSRAIESANTLLVVTNGDGVAGNPSISLPLSNGWIIKGNGSDVATKYRDVKNEVATTSDNITYAIAYSIVSGSESVYLNGLLQRAGGTYDYVISAGTVIFNSANASVDVVIVTYLATN